MNRRLLSLSLSFFALGAAADAQVVRRGTLRDSDRAVLASAPRWLADAQAKSGAVTRLLSRIELGGATAEEKYADFLARFGPIFDADKVTMSAPRVLSRHPGGAARHLRADQIVNGARVVGHGLTIELDREGRMVCAHGVVSREAAALAPPSISADAAVAIAANRLASMGYSPGSFRRDPHYGFLLVVLAGGAPHLAHRIEAIVKQDLVPFAVDVDASSGSVLRAFEDRVSFLGEGSFQNGMNVIPFVTKNGKGIVYKDFKSAGLDKPSNAPLPEVGFETAVVGAAEDDTLFGRYAWVLRAATVGMSVELFTVPGTNHAFLGFPTAFGPALSDLFDSTNCYFHLTKFALRMAKIAGQPLPTDYAMPTVTNYPSLLNAFFSPQDLGVNTGPGYMEFGDLSPDTGTLADDFSRDPTVMCHEYTHAITTFAGLEFLFDEANSPARAVNEAIADYFAASFFKDPRIGFPLSQLASTTLKDAMGIQADGLRNLAAPKTYVDNLFDDNEGGIPEEHAAGHVFGCALWRLRTALKQKITDELVLFSPFNWPQSLAEIGAGPLTPANAADAYKVFFGECAAQLIVDAFAISKAAGLKALGAILTNGVVGDADIAYVPLFDVTEGESGTISSAFLGTSSGHGIALTLNAGQTMDVSIAGNTKDGTIADLGFDGPPGGLAFPNLAKVTANGVSIKGVQANVAGTYFLYFLNAGPNGFTPHRYKATLKVK